MKESNEKPYPRIIRWGMIGCGAVTEVKSAPAYQQTAGFELHAVMCRHIDAAADYARRHHVAHYYDDAEQLIADPNIDGIYIATPPDSHKYYGLKVAEAGKICCIEKPLSPSYADSLEIVTAFESADLPLFVAYYRRSLPRFNQVKDLLEQAQIGQVRHVCWHFNKAPNDLDLQQLPNWRTDKQIAPGGYFEDLASHGLDLFAYLLGDFAEVNGISTNQQGLYNAADAISACWRHQNGVTGTGSWNFGCDGRKDDVVIYGSKGQLQFSMFDQQPIICVNEQGMRQWQVDNPPHIQQYHVKNMADFLFNQTTLSQVHPSTGTTALHTSWVMEQILAR